MREERNSIQATPSCNWSEEQRIAVREEMKHILAHPTIRNSDRCSEFLGYVVNRVLEGRENEIKEHTLGVEVFERDVNYDSASDPVVRRFANEVRKRLAQYYQEEPDGHIVKIHMPRGSYIPECEFLSADNQRLSTAQDASAEEALAATMVSKRHSTFVGKYHLRQLALLVLGAIVLLAVAGLMFRSTSIFRSPINRIWEPILAAKAPVIICLNAPRLREFPPPQGGKPQAPFGPKDKTHAVRVSASQSPSAPAPGAMHKESSPLSPNIMFGDVVVGNSISDFLSSFHKHYEVRTSSNFKYSDSQRGPVVLIGCIKDEWTLTLLANVRYSVQYDWTNDDGWIQDAKEPARREWKSKAIPERWHETQDYAVITRVFNGETGQWIFALTGIGGHGTQAAARFLTDPKLAKMIPRYIRDSGNFQIVLRTTLMGEEPGPIQIVAGYTW